MLAYRGKLNGDLSPCNETNETRQSQCSFHVDFNRSGLTSGGESELEVGNLETMAERVSLFGFRVT